MELAMNLEERTLLRRLDWNLIIVILTLNVIGLINLYSATHGPTAKEVEPLFLNQIIWLLIGWCIFFLFTFFDYVLASRLAWVLYILNLGAILWVTFFGKVALGAQRWIDFGFFRYQPSETMKLGLIILLAKVLSTRNTYGRGMGFRELFLPMIAFAIPFALIAEQPDLGTAMMLTAIAGTMILFTKVRRIIIVGVLVLGIVGAYGAWKFALREYQRNRILTFISPSADPRGSGYNSIQSKIAVGSGKFLGKGFRKGTQSQLEFLPERHTDFIFSVLSEEYGFVGSFLTVGLFFFLFIIVIRIATYARDKLGALLCIGILSYVFWHMFVNIGMVIGLLPIVGVPLPLLSYGGSSMLTTMAGLGLISSVAFRRYLF